MTTPNFGDQVRGVANSPHRRGSFILFEGIDRCGKTTQAAGLLEHLRSAGIPAEMWRFPDRGTVIGGILDSYLKREVDLGSGEAHMLFVANRWERKRDMLSAMQEGTTIVVDRYGYSSIAYTTAKGVNGLDLDWCRAMDAGLPSPDLVFYLRMSPDVSCERAGYGGERYETQCMQCEVSDVFDCLLLDADNCVVIDATQPVDVIRRKIADATMLSLARSSKPAP